MTLWIAMAFLGGVLVSLSRQVNGRLSLSNSPLIASLWNHLVGFVVLTADRLGAQVHRHVRRRWTSRKVIEA